MIRTAFIAAAFVATGAAGASAQVQSGVQQVPSGVSQTPATSAPSLSPPPTPGTSSIPGPLIQSGRTPGSGAPERAPGQLPANH